MSSFRFEALQVFGAVMRWDRAERKWCFPLILEEREYAGRLVLGDWRAKAAVALHELAPVVLVTGGSNTHPETGESCSRAVELARLIVSYGVPEKKVISMGKIGASHTLGNVANLTEYLCDHQEIRHVGMVCPRFQMLRAMAMQYADPYYKKEGGIELGWIEVERTLVEAGVLLKSEVDAVYTSPEVDICWKMEQRGMQDFLTGSYEPKLSA